MLLPEAGFGEGSYICDMQHAHMHVSERRVLLTVASGQPLVVPKSWAALRVALRNSRVNLNTAILLIDATLSGSSVAVADNSRQSSSRRHAE